VVQLLYVYRNKGRENSVTLCSLGSGEFAPLAYVTRSFEDLHLATFGIQDLRMLLEAPEKGLKKKKKPQWPPHLVCGLGNR
jgi:hypothetical protein